jgi:diacylglycerol kinase
MDREMIKSFKYAFSGLWYAIITQRNMRIHLAAALTVALLAWLLELSRWEFAILTITVSAVMIAELLNTALETVVDMVSPEFHPLAKRAKDLAAGAVLISAIAALAVGCFLFWPYLFR